MRSVRTLFAPLALPFKYFSSKAPKMRIILKKYVGCLITVFLVLIAIGLICLVVVSWLHRHPVVRTNRGMIRGLRALDGDYTMYMGIPYAMVNESNPFGHSIPYPHFKGIYDAHDDSIMCPQIEEYNNTVTGRLDCLNLNIHVPNSARTTHRLPVLVYIFGGRFEVGAASRYFYGPKFLVKHDIILVTLNYRLGPYGFQCLDTPEVPGNQGLKDQVLALRWVKENIEAFGGDSNRITIAGESSGGQNVDFHVTYGEEGLFSHAIIGAGAALNSVSTVPSDNTVPLRIADELGFTTDDINEALEFIAKQDTDSVITASSRLNIKYGPCVEQKFQDVESFVTEFPKESINVKGISVIIGQSNDEMFHVFANVDFNNDEFKDIFKVRLSKYFDFGDKLQDMVDYVRHFYIGDEVVSEAVKPQIIDFCSDLFQNYPIYKKLQQYVRNKVRIYYSMFAYSGRRNFMKVFNHVDFHNKGASHVDEIGYLFDVAYMKDPLTPNDKLIVDMMTTLWSNFVKFGRPIIKKTDLLPVEWKPVVDGSLPYLKVDLEVSSGNAPFHDRMKFWDEFFKVNGTFDRKGQ